MTVLRHGSVRERLLSRVIWTQDDCWEYLGCGTSGGYGVIHAYGRQTTAHRASYEEFVAPVEPDLVVDHLCRNRRCVNPLHLEPVSQKENVARGEARKRTACRRGHTDHWVTKPNSQGRLVQFCMECARIRDRERNKRRYIPKAARPC